MEILKGWVRGCHVNFKIGTLEAGIKTEVDGISISEDDFEWISPIVLKNYPSFYIYETVNPINRSILESIDYDIYEIILWLKNGEADSKIQYYVDWINKYIEVQSFTEVISFFEELESYLRYLLDNYDFDFLNLEGL